MKNNILFNTKNFFIAFLFLFSLLINQYYGNRGIFPADSFAHFDTGFRILLGEYPFKDYWVVSGPLVDYLQAIFFYFFWRKLAKLRITCIINKCCFNSNHFFCFKKF